MFGPLDVSLTIRRTLRRGILAPYSVRFGPRDKRRLGYFRRVCTIGDRLKQTTNLRKIPPTSNGVTEEGLGRKGDSERGVHCVIIQYFAKYELLSIVLKIHVSYGSAQSICEQCEASIYMSDGFRSYGRRINHIVGTNGAEALIVCPTLLCCYTHGVTLAQNKHRLTNSPTPTKSEVIVF